MKGLEISKAYWKEYGEPLFREKFPQHFEYIAVGLVGAGSECYGFDDEISRDHDFEQGFCIFLPSENKVDRRTEFLMERAYALLPKEFMGLTRSKFNPAGGNRHGVFRISDFYNEMTGIPNKPTKITEWMALPDYALYEVTNGEVFYDKLGRFTEIREAWANPPKDLIYKKMCGNLISMSQTGEYNYPRCILRKDFLAARLTANEFVKYAMGAAFWTLGKPVPYYKWCFRAMSEIPELSPIYPFLVNIINHEDTENSIKSACGEILNLIKAQNILADMPSDLQSAALMLNKKISDVDLRNLSPLATV